MHSSEVDMQVNSREHDVIKDHKRWNNEFTGDELEACRIEWMPPPKVKALMVFNHWPHDYKQPKLVEALDAAYELPGHENWQRFRVSMKGLNTEDKLAMLLQRWDYFRCDLGDYIDCDHFVCKECPIGIIETVRIMNYIGSLRRAGILDENLDVAR